LITRRRNAHIYLSVIFGSLLNACASVPDVGTGSSAAAQPGEPSPQVVRPKRAARVEASTEYDFTIRESIRIPVSLRSEYANAMQALDAGDLRGGIERLQALVEKAPELTAPHVDLGIAHLNSGDFEAAEVSLKIALLLTPRHPVAANELGILYRRTGRFELAKTSFETALSSFSNYHIAQRNLGVLCDLFLNDLPCALANYQAYQRAFPEQRDPVLWISDVEQRMRAAGDPI
jgi:Flp pilus assembly protein TadD